MSEQQSVTAAATHDGAVVFTFLRQREDGVAQFERTTIEVSLREAYRLMSNLPSILNDVSDTRLRHLSAGDCATCQNWRMVDAVAHAGTPAERKIREHCPDCYGRYSNPDVPYPKLRES